MIDLSASSRAALQWAVKDAAVHQYSLTIVHPYRLKGENSGHQKTSLKKRLEDEANQRFENLKATIPELKNVPYAFSPEVGFETDRMDSHIQKRNVKLIVLNKDIAKTNELQGEWGGFLARIQVPVVLIP
jgi:hypothetical protein